MLHALPCAAAHGMMLYPNQRGCLNPSAPYVTHPVPAASSSEIDFFMHFPSGVKHRIPGSGHRSQIARAGRRGWVPYNPFDASFRLRAGVCGDTVTGRDHLAGGKFYDGGRIAAVYTQGGVINLEFGITAHHNGFLEVFVCDVSKCPGGDISHACFVQGHCAKLRRAGADVCQKPGTKVCGPVDRNYPTRWYIPCETAGKPMNVRKGKDRAVLYGPGTIRYRLPAHLYCAHCVLQMYWTTANNCNPPGVIEYFTGPDRPRWPRCKGQGGAVAGYTTMQKECGREKLPEEYYQCSDIRILPAAKNNKPSEPQRRRKRPAKYFGGGGDGGGGKPRKGDVPQQQQHQQQQRRKSSAPPPPPPPPRRQRKPQKQQQRQQPKKYDRPTPPPQQQKRRNNPIIYNKKKSTPRGSGGNGELRPRADGYGAVVDILLVRNGRRVQSLFAYDTSKFHAGSAYSVEAAVTPSTAYVRFQVYVGAKVVVDRVHRRAAARQRGRMYLFGRRRDGLPFAWKGRVPVGKKMKIVVTARDAVRTDIDTAYLTFYR